METLVINRDNWRRQLSSDYIGPAGDDRCCIVGHYYLFKGMSVELLREQQFASYFDAWLSARVTPRHRTNSQQAICINDDSRLSDAEAEQQLTELFKTNDIDLQFTGERR